MQHVDDDEIRSTYWEVCRLAGMVVYRRSGTPTLNSLSSLPLSSRCWGYCIYRHAEHKGKLSNEYDLSGLVEKLKKLAPEIIEASEMKKKVTRKGGLTKTRA